MKSRKVFAFVVFVIFMGTEGFSLAITDEQATAILNELKQIRTLLEKQQQAQRAPNIAQPAAPMRASVTVNGSYSIGREDAPLTLVEFTDYECPFCRQFHASVFEEIKTQYIDTGKIRYVARDLPLEFHRYASLAAQAARCAGDQGKYWEVRDALIANASNLNEESIRKYARTLAVDMEPFQVCLDNGKYKNEIQKDVLEAQRASITGTPTFVLGRTAPERIEGELIVGAQPFITFDTKIKELLAKSSGG